MVLIRVWTFEGLGEPAGTLNPGRMFMGELRNQQKVMTSEFVSVVFAVHWNTLFKVMSDLRRLRHVSGNHSCLLLFLQHTL